MVSVLLSGLGSGFGSGAGFGSGLCSVFVFGFSVVFVRFLCLSFAFVWWWACPGC